MVVVVVIVEVAQEEIEKEEDRDEDLVASPYLEVGQKKRDGTQNPPPGGRQGRGQRPPPRSGGDPGRRALGSRATGWSFVEFRATAK